MLVKLWLDEDGAILSAELILIMTILVIGLAAGLKNVQDTIVTKLSNIGAAIGSIDQSFAWSGTKSYNARTSGSQYGRVLDQPSISSCTDGVCVFVE